MKLTMEDVLRIMQEKPEIDEQANELADVFMTLCAAMGICTAFAHERGDDLPKTRHIFREATIKWLGDYQNIYGENPLSDTDVFFHRVVLMARDEMEYALGVRERKESAS